MLATACATPVYGFGRKSCSRVLIKKIGCTIKLVEHPDKSEQSMSLLMLGWSAEPAEKATELCRFSAVYSGICKPQPIPDPTMLGATPWKKPRSPSARAISMSACRTEL